MTGANVFDLLTLTVTEPLEPGAEIRRTNQVIFPASQVGERFLLVTTDVNDDVAETGPAENNTRASTAAFTIAAPDLAVTRVSAPAGTFGAPVTVTWVVENSGNAAAEAVWTDRVFLEFGDARRLLQSQAPATGAAVAIGGRYTNTVTLTLPLDTASVAGPHRFVVVADALADVLEAREDNNSAASVAGELALPPLPDLTVTAVTFPANAVAGTEVDVTWTVTNAGTAPAPAPWLETFALSADATPGADVPLIGLTVEQSLAAGASVTRTNRVRIPASLAGGFTVLAGTDTGGAVVEGNEANNFGAAPNRINLPAKLTLELAVASVTEGDVPPVLRGRLFRTGSTTLPPSSNFFT
jgi:subtilase family serine protease